MKICKKCLRIIWRMNFRMFLWGFNGFLIVFDVFHLISADFEYFRSACESWFGQAILDQGPSPLLRKHSKESRVDSLDMIGSRLLQSMGRTLRKQWNKHRKTTKMQHENIEPLQYKAKQKPSPDPRIYPRPL